MFHVICNKEQSERNFCKATNIIIATRVTGPADSSTWFDAVD